MLVHDVGHVTLADNPPVDTGEAWLQHCFDIQVLEIWAWITSDDLKVFPVIHPCPFSARQKTWFICRGVTQRPPG